MLFKCAVLFALIVKVLCLNLNLYEDHIGTLSNYTFKTTKHNDVLRLDLRGNGIDSISHTAFSGFDNLETLSLMQNNIKCLPENVFNDVKNIYFLGLDVNKIKHLHKNIFSKLRKLKFLRLQHNLLSNLEVGLFDNNFELNDINLQDNRLTFIRDGLFSHLPVLSIMNLGMNYIHHIDKSALPLSLRHLYLFANKLQHFDIDVNVINTFKSFNIDKNPLYCDCNLKSLFKQWDSSFKMDGWVPICEGPKSIRDQSWADLTENKFVCDQDEIEFGLENNGIVQIGENVIFLCRFNRLVSDITITYNNKTKVSDNLQSNKKLYSTQSASTEKESWYNLTVKNIQINDSGNYKCVVKVNEETKLEKMITLTVEDPDGNVCCDV